MSAHDARRRSPLGRRPGRQDRERALSMELPERLRYNEQEEKEELKAARRADQPQPFMAQSVFGIFAATQSKMNSQTSYDDHMDASEDELESNSASARQQPPQGNSSGKQASQSSTKSRLRLSKPRLLRAIPGIKSKPALPATTMSTSPHYAPSSLRSSPSPSVPTPAVPSPPQEQEDPTPDEAPFMSQMLQARANADIDSSEATLTRPKSGRQSPNQGSSTRRPSLALPEALKDIFDFENAEEVIAEYKCWYLQSVLLEGYMYITQNHISFYAYLPKKGNVVIKSGHLSKRGRHNPQYRRYWFVLKGDVLSYYQNRNDPYFPRDSIDLRYGISAQVVPDRAGAKDNDTFSVTTNTRTFYFRADSAQSANEWVKQLQKIIFRSRNDGDSVKISIPTDNVLEIEENPLLDFADTIRIKVIDNDETFAMDEYFFSFFGSDGANALHDLRVMTQNTVAQRAITSDKDAHVHDRALGQKLSPMANVTSPCLAPGTLHEHVRAELSPSSSHLSSFQSPSTSGELSRSNLDIGQPLFDRSRSKRGKNLQARPSPYEPGQRKEHFPTSHESQYSSDAFATSSENIDQNMVESREGTDTSGSQILSGSKMFHDPTIRKIKATAADENTEQRSAWHSEDTSSGSERVSSTPRSKHEASIGRKSSAATSKAEGEDGQTAQQAESSSALGGIIRAGTIPIQRATGYLRGPGKAVASLLGTSPMGYYDRVTGMIAGGQRHYTEVEGLSPNDHVRDPDDEADVQHAERRFREHFALPDSERLVATYFAFLHRVLPMYGKIYVGTTKLCFRSLLLGTRTKLIVPLKDIMTVEKEKGFRLGYQGMVVVIRGHEEIFFEFGKQAHRDDCTITILRLTDTVTSVKETVVLQDGEHRTPESQAAAVAAAAENDRLTHAREEGQADRSIHSHSTLYEPEADTPAVLFDDTYASMLDFKPPKSLRVVCLTIGSRGDVQPYIALCKGLIADGHRPKIVTHAEFKDWVESHGIDFAPVGGNPADLMRICVEYGMFTPSFLLEANLKFRGFVRELLDTAWAACKDAELLVESPSAMAGIHIAEALGIPYFRAFTMPWTRTRAYPHAFAVPGHRLGGAYNWMTYVLFDHLFWQSTSWMVNRWRGDSLELKPTTADKLQQDKVPFLYNFSPSVVPPPLDFSEWIRVTGYWFLDEGLDYKAARALQDFIDKARQAKQRLVYIGFGSVVVSNSKELTQNVVDAVLKADVRCILAKGWSDRLDKGPVDNKAIEVPLPSSILQVTDPVPHDWLFRQVDAVVHHGGAGTTGASIRAGVPTVIHPFFGDQFFFSSRVQDLGVGIEVKHITTKSLGRALWIACHDHRMREKAKALGEQIRSEDGVGTAIKAIYRDMEYARTLVKKREPSTKPTGESSSGDTEEDDEEEEVEEWTLVDNDSDPEAASPKAMMQPERARSASKGRRRSGLTH
ncbi:hypothetical protein AAFC00_001094 [Neodothiora populina]|uniref:sterol 3beta-glucosyltransferase n=1 Tax=Neodothiora populina TaxID=2781224 RepID=A0ABR3PMR6_9PEZI